MEFVQKVLNDGANYFIRAVTQEAELQKTLASEMQRKLQEELKEKRDETDKEKREINEKLSKFESLKVQAEMKENLLREQVNELRVEKENLEKKLREETSSYREENERVIYELRTKCLSYEENMKKGQRDNILLLSEFEKEKALLLQKIQHLEKSLEEFNKKEKVRKNTIILGQF